MAKISDIVKRKEEYLDLGKQKFFNVEELTTYKHNALPYTYFLKVVTLVSDGGQFKRNEVLEYLDPDDGKWKDIRKTLDEKNYNEFLKDCKVCSA